MFTGGTYPPMIFRQISPIFVCNFCTKIWPEKILVIRPSLYNFIGPIRNFTSWVYRLDSRTRTSRAGSFQRALYNTIWPGSKFWLNFINGLQIGENWKYPAALYAQRHRYEWVTTNQIWTRQPRIKFIYHAKWYKFILLKKYVFSPLGSILFTCASQFLPEMITKHILRNMTIKSILVWLKLTRY